MELEYHHFITPNELMDLDKNYHMTTSYFVPLSVNYSCTVKLNLNLIKPPDINMSFRETLGLGGLVKHQQNDTVRSIQTVRSSVGQ